MYSVAPWSSLLLVPFAMFFSSAGLGESRKISPDVSRLKVDRRRRTSDESASNIAYIKLQKTGSSTTATVLMRYAYTHNETMANCLDLRPDMLVRLPACAEKVRAGIVPRADMMVHHISSAGGYHDGDFRTMRAYYEQILSDERPVHFLTSLREPRSQYISNYYYFLEPQTRVPIEEYLRQERIPENLQCGSLGIHDEAALDLFLTEYLPMFTLIFLAEEFDESMVLLARIMGWELKDVMYETMNVNLGTFLRPTGEGQVVAIQQGPEFEKLSPVAQERLSVAVKMDDRLYAAARGYYAAIKAQYADVLQADLEEFQRLQANPLGVKFGHHRGGCLGIYSDYATCFPGAHWGSYEYLDCLFG